MSKKKKLAELYKAVVKKELGVPAKIDDVGDVVFKHPALGGFYFNLDAKNDPEYMMLVFPAFFDAKQGVSEEQLLEICNKLNGKCKGVKLTVADTEDRDVMATLEMLVAAPNTMPGKKHLAAVIKRSLSMMGSAVKQFVDKAKKVRAAGSV